MEEFDLNAIYDNLVKEEEKQQSAFGHVDPIWQQLHSTNAYYRERALADPNVKLEHILHALKDKNVGVAAKAAAHPLLTPEYFGAVLSHTEARVKQALLENPNMPPEALSRLLHLAESSHTIDRLLDHPNITSEHLLQMQSMDPPAWARDKILSHPRYDPGLLNQMVMEVINGMKNGTPTRMHPEGYMSFLRHASTNPNILPEVARSVIMAGPLPSRNPNDRHDFSGQAHLARFVHHPTLQAEDLSQIIAHPLIDSEIKMEALKHSNATPKHLKELLDGNAMGTWQDNLSHYDVYKLFDHDVYARFWTPENIDAVLANKDIESGPVRSRLVSARKDLLTPEQLENLAQDPFHEVRELVAANQHTPPHVLAKLVGDSARNVAEAAINNNAATSEVALKALNSPHRMVAAEAARHEQLPPDYLSQLVAHPNPIVREAIATHSRLDPEQLNSLLNDPDPTVGSAAAFNPNLTPQQILKVAQMPTRFGIHNRRSLLTRSNVPPEAVEHLMRNDPDEDVRIHAAKSDRLSNEAAARFLDEYFENPLGSTSRIRALVQNGRLTLPRHHLMNIIRDHAQGRDIRQMALQNAGLSQDDLRDLMRTAQDGWLKDAIGDKIGDLDPDSVHTENVKIRFNTGKLRKVRDLILASGKDEMRPKDLPAGDYSMARLPNGNISASKLQAYINNQEATPFNVSHSIWNGIQRHTGEEQKVFQLNLTTAQVNKLQKLGLYNQFRKINDTYRGGHPLARHSIGWVRYSGTPQDGIFIDEVQSDMSVPAADRAAAQRQTQLQEIADAAIAEGKKPKIAPGSKKWEKEINETRQKAEERWGPAANHKAMVSAIMGNKHPHEVLHEAFQQYLRDKGHVGARVSVHTVESKAKHTGRDEGRAESGHINAAYRDAPKKLGMEPSTYGQNMPTQTNDTLRGQPTWEGEVRKYEKLKSLIKELVLAKVTCEGT
jgi:hypothetical protein